MPTRAVKLGRLELRSLIVAVAGPHVDDGEKIRRTIRAGAGAVVTKTICAAPQSVVSPSLGATPDGALAHVQRASEIPADLWFARELPLGALAAREAGVPLIASVGFTPSDALTLAPRAADAGADAVEINLRSSDPDELLSVARRLRARLTVPIWVKIPAMADPTAIATRLGPFVDGFTAIDSLEGALAIDPSRGGPWLGGPLDDHAVSGPPLKPIALHAVHALRRAGDHPILGVGGVRSARDAVELLIAGANAVGVATAAILEGDSIYRRLDAGVGEWMRTHGGVGSLIGSGAAVDRPMPTGPPRVDLDACESTGRCATVCPYDAIERDDRGAPVIETLRCVRCGLCVTTCPAGALAFTA